MNPMISHIFIPLFLYVCIFVSGFIISISLGLMKSSADGHCPLYITIPDTSAPHIKDVWGAESTCLYVIYMPVIAHVLYPFVMIVIYLYYAMKRNDSIANIMDPFFVMLINATIFILTFVSACIVTTGGSTTCSSFESLVKSKFPKIIFRCSYLENIPDGYPLGKFYERMVLGEITTWICLLWWLALIVPSVLRQWRQRRALKT